MSIPIPERVPLRRALIAAREARLADLAARATAESSLGAVLADVLRQLDPTVLGAYWPIRGEFNPAPWLAAAAAQPPVRLALPFARRVPREMHYRAWDGSMPVLRDDCGIPASDGAPVVPDVVLAPCVGFTPEGYRLGYGGGYFDRWIAAHPGVTAVGIAWGADEIAPGAFAPAAHDRPLDLIVTERGVRVSG